MLLCAAGVFPASAQRQMENLGRGVIALRKNSTQVYVGWRMLGNDPDDIAFNLYRTANGGGAVKVNGTPLTTTTDYLDTPGSLSTTAYSYYVRPVINGVEGAASAAAVLAANPATRQYLTVPLQAVIGGTAPPYDVKFCWVGDFDGDGEYDFLVDRLSTTADQQQYLQAYKRDGTLLWQMNMGPNSTNQYAYEPGSSAIDVGDTDNVTVYDLDGDGKAEVAVRTANGVTIVNAAGTTIGTISAASDTSQFVSIIDGLSGTELARTALPNPWAQHGTLTSKCGIAYVDGRRPSVLFYGYNRADSGAFYRVFTMFDYRDGALTQRWSWAQNLPGSEGHQIRIADVDNDGKDEICDLGHTVDDNGTQLFSNELTHGDRFHITDIDPDRPGLETFAIQQLNPSYLATAFYDSATGKMIKKWYANGLVDVGRGLAIDIDPNHKGYEMYSTQPGIFDSKGNQIYANNVWAPEGLWWDADLAREFIDGAGSGALNPTIDKFDAATGNKNRLFTLYNDGGNFSTHQAYGGRPAFWGDILGDWREELVLVTSDYSALRIYSTTVSATNRLYTLMHNPQYRNGATTKGYVQGSNVDYYLGYGMTPPPPPPMADAKLVWRGGTGATTWDAGSTASWRQNGANSAYADGDTVRFDLSGDNTTPVALTGTLSPGAVTVYNPKDYTFAGTGALAGAMKLTKVGAGTLTLPGTHLFTGKTVVWDGALLVNGNLQQSPVTVWGGIWGGPLAAGKTGGRIGGTGQFSQPVTVKYRGAVTPGAGMNSAGTTTFAGGLTAEDDATLALDLSDDPTGVTKVNDRIAVTGNLALGGTVNIVVNPLNTKLAAGTYTLLTYTGALTGSLSNLSVTVPAGTPYMLANPAGAITLTVPVTRAPASLVWTGGVTGNKWDLGASQNWQRSGSADTFVASDTVLFDATGAANPTVNLTTVLPTAGVTVNAATNYTFTGTGSLSGAGGLTKSGAGLLTVATTNVYTGPTVVNGGILAVDNLGDGGAASSIGASDVTASNFVLNGGTLRLTGSQTNTNRNLSLGAGGGTIDLPTSGVFLQISGAISGGGALVKTGAGALILANESTFTGGTTIKTGGGISLASFDANQSGLGTGAITLDGGTLSMSNIQQNNSPAWNLIVPTGSTGRLDADGRCSLNGTLTGGGTFTFWTPFVRTDLKGNWSAFTGQINVVTDSDGGDFRVTNTFGYANAAINLGDQVYAYYNTANSTATIDMGELSGVAGATLLGAPTAGRTVTWRIGGRNTNSTFAGVIKDSTGPSAITKIGTGTLTLTGANTYTGATTVSAGKLVVNGSLSGSAVSVQSGGGLGGAGAITGNVTLAGGSNLVASLSSTPLTITGNVAASGTITITGSVPGAGTYEILSYSGTMTGTPTFVWSGAGYTATFNTAVSGKVSATFTSSGVRPAAPLTWSGANSAAWDAATTNWKFTASGTATTFLDEDPVRFDDTLTGNPAVTLAAAVAPATVTFAAATTTYSLASAGAGISGATSVAKSGAAKVTFTGANAYTGGTTISGGIFALGSDGATTAALVQHPGLSGGNSVSLGTGAIIANNGGQLRLGGRGGGTVYTFTTANPLSFDSATLVSYDGLQRLTGGVTINGGGAALITAWNTKNLFINSALSGAGPVAIDDLNAGGSDSARGIVRIDSASNPYSGTITINGTSTGYQGGRLQIENNTALINATILNNNTAAAGLNFTVTAPQIGALGGVADVTIPGGSLTVGGNGASTSYSGVLSGSGALVKTGTGTFTLAGNSTFTGATTISAGTLALSGSLTNTTTVEVLSGATLNLTGTLTTGTLTIRAGGKLIGGGTINATVVNEGLIEATGVATFAFNGPLTNSGTMRFLSGAGFTRSGNFVNTGTLDVITAGAAVSGPTSGGGVVLTAESTKVTGFSVDAGGIPTLTMPTYAGHAYQLQRAIDLADDTWENAGASLPGNGAVQSFIDPAPTGEDRAFYRVLVSP